MADPRETIKNAIAYQRWTRIKSGLRNELREPMAVEDKDADAILRALNRDDLIIIDRCALQSLRYMAGVVASSALTPDGFVPMSDLKALQKAVSEFEQSFVSEGGDND